MKTESRYERAKALIHGALGDAGRDVIQKSSEANAVYHVAVRAVEPLLPFPFWEFRDEYARIRDLQVWAYSVMESREPDFVIGPDPIKGDYMHRWHIIPRNALLNLYLHRTYKSDDDVMHDHPWDSTSLILRNGYIEQTPEGEFARKPGDTVHRKADSAHRLELIDGQPSVSLFMTGPKVRDWGFHCPNGWVPWQQFTAGDHGGRGVKGAGCGEYA